MGNEETRLQSYINQQTPFQGIKRRFGVIGRDLFGRGIKFIRNGRDLVIFAPPFARGGNWLYEWAFAYEDAIKNNRKVRVCYIPGMEDWIEEFPRLQELTIQKKNIPVRDQRQPGFYQDIKNRENLECFIKEVLLHSPRFSQRLEKFSFLTEDDLIINVRRGDYYSNPTIQRNFGINTIEYVRKAAEEAFKVRNFKKIYLVSDDLNWCQINLDFLSEYAPTSFAKNGEGMFDDLAFIASASTIILTNTTFGYWGAYIAECQRLVTIFAPNMHERETLHQKDIMQHKYNWLLVAPDLSDNWL